jgi:hypothetical protein
MVMKFKYPRRFWEPRGIVAEKYLRKEKENEEERDKGF